MANGIEAYIFTLVLTTLVVLVGTVGRFWILRDRPRTFAVNLSDSAVISFCLAMVFLAGLGFDVVNSELVERVYGSEDPRSRSLNIKSLKVSQAELSLPWSKNIIFYHSVSNWLFSRRDRSSSLCLLFARFRCGS